MKIVVGFPVKARAWALPSWFTAVEGQGIDVDVLTVLSPSTDGTEQILLDHGATILYDEQPGRPVHDIVSHLWGKMDWYTYMANLRNGLLIEAMSMGADYFFSLDSDVILPDGALEKLLDYSSGHPGVVAPAVNMATGQLVWNTMSWTHPAHPGLAHRPVKEPLGGLSDVVMAAMLLDRVGMEARWQAHQQGEDVGFAIDARSKEVPMWWVPSIKCTHYMRKC